MTTATLTTGAQALADARAAIEASMAAHPRSQQREIGPSEIGNPCDHCLAARLAHWPKSESVAWLPFIGTAVHAELDVIMTMANRDRYRWATEQKVMVGTIGGREIWGSCDLYDHDTGTVIDWKIVGKATLDKARRGGPSPVYRTQAHLYGLGWTGQGQDVRHVAIAFLPRQAVSLDHAVWWTEPHDPQVGWDALERADRLDRMLASLAAVSTGARDAYITSLPRDPGCWDCARYPDRPTPEIPATLDSLAI